MEYVTLCIYGGFAKSSTKSMANMTNQLRGDFQHKATCTSQPIALNRHLTTFEHLTCLKSKPQQKQTH